MKKTVTITVELEAELKEQLEAICEKNKTTIAEVIKEYCVHYVKSGGISESEAEQSKELNGIPT